MKKHIKWILVALVLAYTIGIEIYHGGEKLPWTIIFVCVVMFSVANAAQRYKAAVPSLPLIGPFTGISKPFS